MGSTLEFGGFQESVFMLVGLLKITPSLYDISGSELLCPQTRCAGKEAQARGLHAGLTSLRGPRQGTKLSLASQSQAERGVFPCRPDGWLRSQARAALPGSPFSGPASVFLAHDSCKRRIDVFVVCNDSTVSQKIGVSPCAGVWGEGAGIF